MKLLSTGVATAIGLVMFGAVSASASTVGNDVIDRNTSDGRNDFILVMEDLFPTNGIVTSWSAWIERFEGGSDQNLGLVILRDKPSDNYEIVGVDTGLINNGLGKYTFSSNVAVKAGDRLGIWMTDAKVSFDDPRTGGSGDFTQSGGGLFSAAPTIGQTFVKTDTFQRTYSFAAELSPVPIPASFPLVLAGLGALSLVRRKKRSKS